MQQALSPWQSTANSRQPVNVDYLVNFLDRLRMRCAGLGEDTLAIKARVILQTALARELMKEMTC